MFSSGRWSSLWVEFGCDTGFLPASLRRRREVAPLAMSLLAVKSHTKKVLSHVGQGSFMPLVLLNGYVHPLTILGVEVCLFEMPFLVTHVSRSAVVILGPTRVNPALGLVVAVIVL